MTVTSEDQRLLRIAHELSDHGKEGGELGGFLCNCAAVAALAQYTLDYTKTHSVQVSKYAAIWSAKAALSFFRDDLDALEFFRAEMEQPTDG